MSKIINLTPHPLSIYEKCDSGKNCVDGKRLIGTIDPNKDFPTIQCVEKVKEVGNLTFKANIKDGKDRFITVPIFEKKFGEAQNLPPKVKDTYYYVSAISKQCSPSDRTDLLIGNEAVRNEKNQQIGIFSFAR